MKKCAEIINDEHKNNIISQSGCYAACRHPVVHHVSNSLQCWHHMVISVSPALLICLLFLPCLFYRQNMDYALSTCIKIKGKRCTSEVQGANVCDKKKVHAQKKLAVVNEMLGTCKSDFQD